MTSKASLDISIITDYPSYSRRHMAVIRVVFVIIVINTQKFPTSNNISDWIGFTANYYVGNL
ncbi:MAG TPA: hypothetical protein VE524_08885 [Nitrososphaeraceae archaeon]|nr:hypothetical protein [Nitrososphaeraceae archaeon]